jgi:Tfp pilus assembly protein PilN
MFGLSRIPMYIAAFVVLSGVLTGIYYGWKHTVEQQALLEFNQKQLEQVIRDQQDFQSKMSAVEDKQKNIVEDLTKQNDEINRQLKDINEYLSSAEAKKIDRPSSVILKNTINQISGAKK